MRQWFSAQNQPQSKLRQYKIVLAHSILKMETHQASDFFAYHSKPYHSNFRCLFCFHPGIRRLPSSVNNIFIFTSRQYGKVPDDVIFLINQIGLVSSRVQGLNHIITTFSSFFQFRQQTVQFCGRQALQKMPIYYPSRVDNDRVCVIK
jgi:hypothetical protein